MILIKKLVFIYVCTWTLKTTGSILGSAFQDYVHLNVKMVLKILTRLCKWMNVKRYLFFFVEHHCCVLTVCWARWILCTRQDDTNPSIIWCHVKIMNPAVCEERQSPIDNSSEEDRQSKFPTLFCSRRCIGYGACACDNHAPDNRSPLRFLNPVLISL